MILPVNEAPEWDSDNASELSGFLKTSTGEKMIQLLAFFAPTLLDGADVNKTLVTNGELKGYTNAVGQIISLQHSRPVEAQGVSDNYPDLDRDEFWVETDEESTSPK